MSDDDFDDWLDHNRPSPTTDKLAHLLRWLGLFGAIGLFGVAVLMASKEAQKPRREFRITPSNETGAAPSWSMQV